MPQAGLARNGWHPGELAVQDKMGYTDSELKAMWYHIQDRMTDQLRLFFSSEIPFLPLATLDDTGRPWSSVVAGRGGAVGGYGESPNPRQLLIDTQSWDGDPLVETVAAWENGGRDDYRYLVAGVGVQWWSRRRNKIAGRIRSAKKTGYELQLDLEVNQGVGNCPKYINVREYDPYPHTKPTVVHRVPHMEPADELPQDLIDFIHSADAVYISSVYKAKAEEAQEYPSHAGMNHRGGLPGFLRVRPSDHRTIVLPDFSGDRFMSSLGNIEITGLAGMTMVSPTTGDILYITGDAQNVFGEPAELLMPRQAALTTVKVTGYVFVRDALPIRQKEGTEVKRSPYTPPIKYLREEGKETFSPGEAPTVRIARISLHSEDIATFDFELAAKDKAVTIRPGQAAAIDFTNFLGKPAWSHMAPSKPTSLNDDRVRTWTVSGAHEGVDTRRFQITMREKPEGAVTGALFALARNLRDKDPEKLRDTGSLEIDLGLTGISGEFCLPIRGKEARLIFAAGGIGITPFQSMLEALASRGPDTEADIIISLTAREPHVFIPLLHKSLGQEPRPGIKVHLDVFTNTEKPTSDRVWAPHPSVTEIWHKGRPTKEYWASMAPGRVAFVCGPGGFGDTAEEGFRMGGMPNENIHREGFDY